MGDDFNEYVERAYRRRCRVEKHDVWSGPQQRCSDVVEITGKVGRTRTSYNEMTDVEYGISL